MELQEQLFGVPPYMTRLHISYDRRLGQPGDAVLSFSPVWSKDPGFNTYVYVEVPPILEAHLAALIDHVKWCFERPLEPKVVQLQLTTMMRRMQFTYADGGIPADVM